MKLAVLKAMLLRWVPGRIWWRLVRPQLGACGERVSLPRDGSYTFEGLFLGNHVWIGGRSILWAVHSRIIIRDKVITGPELIIMAGDHNTSLAKKYMIDLGEDEKRPGDDRDVVIEGDVWIGARVTVLKGVTVGRGAVIGAAALVTR